MMTDYDQRLRKMFSRMASNESLADVLDERLAAELIQWGEGIAGQFVVRTRSMDDKEASEYLAPYFSALRKMMRALGHWSIQTDPDDRLNRGTESSKTERHSMEIALCCPRWRSY